ncbi:hypothetical protein ACQRD6_05125 [Prevotella sp. SGI.027]
MRNYHPKVRFYYVVRLYNIKLIRAAVPVSRLNIFRKYMMIDVDIPDGFNLACDVARRLHCSVLAYSPHDERYYPFFNYDSSVKFNPLPK